MRKITLPILAVAFLVFLSGCGVKLDTSTVLEQMMVGMSEVKQFDAVGQLKLSGNSETALFNGLKQLAAAFNGRIDLANLDALKFSFQLDLSGTGAEGDTRIAAEIRGLPDYTYFRVSEANTPANLPLTLKPDARWYKVRNVTEQATGEVLGGGWRLTNPEGAKLREAVKGLKLFTVQTVLGEETIKGTRCYHFAALIDQAAWGSLLDNLSNVTNGQLKFDRSAAMRLATDYTYDLWIGKRDHRLAKLIARGNLAPAGQSESALEVNLSRFNSPVSVVAPSEVKEFTLDSLLQSPLGQL